MKRSRNKQQQKKRILLLLRAALSTETFMYIIFHNKKSPIFNSLSAIEGHTYLWITRIQVLLIPLESWINNSEIINNLEGRLIIISNIQKCTERIYSHPHIGAHPFIKCQSKSVYFTPSLFSILYNLDVFFCETATHLKRNTQRVKTLQAK